MDSVSEWEGLLEVWRPSLENVEKLFVGTGTIDFQSTYMYDVRNIPKVKSALDMCTDASVRVKLLADCVLEAATLFGRNDVSRDYYGSGSSSFMGQNIGVMNGELWLASFIT